MTDPYLTILMKEFIGMFLTFLIFLALALAFKLGHPNNKFNHVIKPTTEQPDQDQQVEEEPDESLIYEDLFGE
jgi:hypothetical protein